MLQGSNVLYHVPLCQSKPSKRYDHLNPSQNYLLIVTETLRLR